MRHLLPKINLDYDKSLFAKWEAPVSVMEKWDKTLCAKKQSEDSTHDVSIYSTIGEYGDGKGMTASKMSAILNNAKGETVTLNINSGGGDFFEGVAIYNLLREYSGDVKVKVVGLAASAASIIAMAGDEIQVAEAGFLMIHNSWTIAMGNKEDFRKVADVMDQFDASMADIYSKRTKIDRKDIVSMMKKETWMSGADALDKNFATSLLESDQISLEDSSGTGYNSSLRKVDIALAKSGMTRSERRTLLKEITGTPCAADTTPTTPCAGDTELNNALSVLLAKLTNQG